MDVYKGTPTLFNIIFVQTVQHPHYTFVFQKIFEKRSGIHCDFAKLNKRHYQKWFQCRLDFLTTIPSQKKTKNKLRKTAPFIYGLVFVGIKFTFFSCVLNYRFPHVDDLRSKSKWYFNENEIPIAIHSWSDDSVVA